MQVSVHPFTHIHILMAEASVQATHEKHTHTYSLGIQYLAQRHFEMQTGEADDQTTALPPEP